VKILTTTTNTNKSSKSKRKAFNDWKADDSLQNQLFVYIAVGFTEDFLFSVWIFQCGFFRDFFETSFFGSELRVSLISLFFSISAIKILTSDE
jgi:nitrate reductase NapE component